MSSLLDAERTADGLADILDVNVSAVRGHVADLENGGLVTSRFHKAGIGRPKKVYSITESGRELFSRRYDWFLNWFVSVLSRTRPEVALDTVATMSEELASEFRETARAMGGTDGETEKVESLVDNLNKVGFRTSLEKNGEGGVRIVRTDCAVLKVAKDNPRLICDAFDTQLLRSVLGEDVELEQTMARGAGCCVHTVGSSRGRKAQGRPRIPD